MAEPAPLSPLDAEEMQLYSNSPLQEVQAPHPISKAEPGYPVKESHFRRLYPQSRCFGHDPELMTNQSILLL